MTIKRSITLAAALAAFPLLQVHAQGALSFEQKFEATAGGIGRQETVVTIQSPGAATTSQGCIARTPGSTADVESCVINGITFNDATTNNGASQTLLASSLVGSLGLTAENFRLVLNAVEVDRALTVEQLYLGFFSGTGSLLYYLGLAPIPQSYGDLGSGIGNFGVAFRLDAGSYTTVNTLLATSGVRIGAAGQFSGVGSGPETLSIVAYSPTAVPEPATIVLMGTGLLGLGLAARRRRPAAKR